MKTYLSSELTEGNLFSAMMHFSVPYLIACFLQTFYGMADLLIIGRFNGAASVTAVAAGSQVMHMLTVMIAGLAMGTTVMISRNIGAGDRRGAGHCIGTSGVFFLVSALLLMAAALASRDGILKLLATPEEALAEAEQYLFLCFLGIPCITAYNVFSSIFRGLGDTKRPMLFAAAAGILNIGLDILLIGPFGMGAAGAAAATVFSQFFSVILAAASLRKFLAGMDLTRRDLHFERTRAKQIFSVGGPIALQEGLIQISFLIITAIADSRGVTIAAAVGIVEKIISFLFLVHSAMLSTVSAAAAQNEGAGKPERSVRALFLGIRICAVYGCIAFAVCLSAAPQIVGLFSSGEPEVVRLGAQYLRTYALDCIFAGVHFCFSGYFSACGKSLYTFLHNMISVCVVRVPGAYLASVLFPGTLYEMGLAAPMGSLLSILICMVLFRRLHAEEKRS